MPDTHDERGGDETPLERVRAFQRAADPNGDYRWPAEEAANINGVPLYFDDIESLVSADNFDAVDVVVARWRKTEEQLAAATARAKKAEALNRDLARSTMRHMEKLGAERDEAKLRAEKAEARLAELGEPETEQRIVGVSGLASTPTQFDLEHRADWCPGVRLEERQVYPTPWRVACRSCGTTERVLGDPPLCSNCAVYAPAAFTGLLAAPRLAADAAPDGRSATETVEQRSEAHGVELEFGKGAAGLSGCCRATKLDDGIRHHCDNTSGAPHTHECGDCAHRWDDDTTEDER